MTPSERQSQTRNSGNSFMTKKNFTSIAFVLLGTFANPAAYAEANIPLRGEGAVNVFFSPKDDISLYVVDFINKSQRRVWLAGYYFTNPDIANAVVQAKERGLDVKVILDSSQFKDDKYSGATYLRNKGVAVWKHSRNAAMHHKFIVCDEDRVGFGSANFTQAAMKSGRGPDKSNAENFNLFVRVPGLTKEYANEFERLLGESTR